MLNFGLKFSQLNSREGLILLDQYFLEFIQQQDIDLALKLMNYRQQPRDITSTDYSQFILQLAPYLEDFIIILFNIAADNTKLQQQAQQYNNIYQCRRQFVERQVLKQYSASDLKNFSLSKIAEQLSGFIKDELTQSNIAQAINRWQQQPRLYQEQLTIAAIYCALMVQKNTGLMLFTVPAKTDSNNLLQAQNIALQHQKIKLGFTHRDQDANPANAQAQANYCLYCHHKAKDSCRTGFKTTPAAAQDSKVANGCPLDQKISEMNWLVQQGRYIAALAIAIIDNPLLMLTGHRICNDCMKACIFQRQEPVNVPVIETNMLAQVLELAWGVEIYLLLSNWNPLKLTSFLPKIVTNKQILVAGAGPAGLALAYYLTHAGHRVLIVDGAKIYPLTKLSSQPIKTWSDFVASSAKQAIDGTGGVMQYGITHRWNKDNLLLLRLLLQRQENLTLIGGVRFGSNITIEQAKNLGFDHVALCTGASRPRYFGQAQYFIKGVYSAVDFLMSLNLNVEQVNRVIRLPAIVVGGGLTAIDAAVEVLHYYLKQIKLVWHKWQAQPSLFDKLTKVERQIAEEFIYHHQLLAKCNTDMQRAEVLQQLGGVRICYRGAMRNSPAYHTNHQELEHAFAIGVEFQEQVQIMHFHQDRNGWLEQVELNTRQILPAKTALIAIGMEANAPQIEPDYLSYFGDATPDYHGSVVKALASAKDNWSKIDQLLSIKSATKKPIDFANFQAILVAKRKVAANIYELQISAEQAAQNFAPGNFYKLQAFSLNFEAIALSPIKIENQIIHFILEVKGASTAQCAKLKTGESISLMGPLGQPYNFSAEEKFILIGENLGGLFLLPLVKHLIAMQRNLALIIKYDQPYAAILVEYLKFCADKVIMCSNDEEFQNQLTHISAKHAASQTKVIANVSNDKIQRISQELTDFNVIARVNAPMQCMMGGLCGQCLQPTSDQKTYYFACAQPDLSINDINCQVMRQRLSQNNLLEKLNHDNF